MASVFVLRLLKFQIVDSVRSDASLQDAGIAFGNLEFRHARFIVVTTYDGDEDIHRALEAGAQGYTIKGMSHQTLVDAVQRVHAGNRFLPPPVVDALAARVPDSDLSSRELEVLNLLGGKSNKDIAQALGIIETTVKSHVSTILERLQVMTEPKLLSPRFNADWCACR